MELEAADSVGGDQPPRPADRLIPGQRVDRAERDQHVGVGGGPVRDLLAGQRLVAGLRRGVDGEHHGRELALPVVVRDLLDRRRPVGVRLEVLRGSGQQLVVEGQLPMPVRLHVHVHIDAGQGGKVQVSSH